MSPLIDSIANVTEFTGLLFSFNVIPISVPALGSVVEAGVEPMVKVMLFPPTTTGGSVSLASPSAYANDIR